MARTPTVLSALTWLCLTLSAAKEVAGADGPTASTCSTAGAGRDCSPLGPGGDEELVEVVMQTDSTDHALNMLQARSAKVSASAEGAAGAARGAAGSKSAGAAESATEDASALGANLSQGAGWSDDRCLKAPEGNACIPDGADPKSNPHLWTHYAYCSGIQGMRYRLSIGTFDCAKKRAPLSRCKMTGGGLNIAQCDNPFCRWQKGDGNYCQNNLLVSCQHGEEPRPLPGPYCVAAGDDPKDTSALWTHFAYCWPGLTKTAIGDCAEKRGALSRCTAGAHCDDPFCRQQKGDGRYCQSNALVSCQGGKEPKKIAPYCVAAGDDPVDNSALWTHFAFCTSGSTDTSTGSCAEKRGALSRCSAGGNCDDPFCRTRADGDYCYGGNVVRCVGDAEPQHVEGCGVRHVQRNFDSYDDDEGSEIDCDVAEQWGCGGEPGQARCVKTGESQSCDTRRRRNGRRRCPPCPDCDSDSGDGRRRGGGDGRRRRL